MTYFLEHPGYGWPDEKWLAPYFLTPVGRQEAFATDNDSWGLTAEGVDGTGGLSRDEQIDIDLTIQGKSDLGILLFYNRWSASDGKAYYSKRDLGKLHTWVRTKHGSRAPVGLFIPFEHALKAVMEFIRTDGALPKCIEWVAAADLPEDAFPEPVVRLRDA
jgi:hypothetical protein